MAEGASSVFDPKIEPRLTMQNVCVKYLLPKPKRAQRIGLNMNTETVKQPTLCERIVAAQNMAYAACNATRDASYAYRQAAAVAVQNGEWKIAIQMDDEANRLSELANKIYATMIGQ